VCLSCSALKPSLKTDASPVFKGRDSQVKNATQQKKSLSDRQTKTAENSRGGELQAPLKQEIQQLNAEMDRIIQGSRQKYQKRHIVSSQDNGTSSDFQDISFNFYDAELTEVVKVVMDLLGANYIFHPDVAGRVSLSVKDTFNNAQLRDLLQGVLHINNLVMVNKDKVWHIMPLAEAPSYVAEERIIFPQEELKPQRGQYIQAFRLHFIAASELIKIIKPYLTQNAQVYAHEQKGILLVCDFPHVLTKVKRLIPLFDESVFADKKAKVYALQYTKAEDVVEKLTSISKEFGLSPEEGSPKSRVSFLPLERLNMVLVIAGDKRVIEFVDAWVHQLDTEIPQSLIQEYGQNIYVYYVQYGRAENIVESLKGVFEEGAREDDEDQKYVSKERTKGPEEQTRQKSQMGSESVSGELTGEVTFMIDETTNSILTKCSSHDYDKILSVIEKLDLYPKQVLIEVLIAEVTLNESTKFGFEWEYLTNLHGDTESIIQVDSGLGFIGEKTRDINKGLTYLVTDTDKITAALRASEEEDNVNILSRPTLLASDNQEAEINIGDEVPIPTTSEVREDDTGTAKTTETTIQYRDTGIIMRVTPHINKQGMVRMELSQEVSNLSKQTVEGVDAPVISTRNAQTTVAVNDGQTVIIGGLMEQTQSSGASGIPYLSRMPFLKYAFGYERSSFSNTELIILITPHVVLNEEDSNVVSKEFVSRVESIKQLMR
jgi:general secretion pathway protein D